MEVELLTPGFKRREAVDCFNCSALNRQCDRARHRCETCSRCSEACGGYPRDWQWLAGVKSRGKQKGRSMSIAASNREWQSITPINHTFIFKQGKPQRKRTHCSAASPKPKSAGGSSMPPSEPSSSITPIIQQNLSLSRPGRCKDMPYSPATATDNAGALPLTLEDLCDPSTLQHIEPALDSYGFSPSNDIENEDGDILACSPSIEPGWIENTSQWQLSTFDHAPSPHASLSPSPMTLEAVELVTWYDAELCVLPLTYDYAENPLRCMSQSAEHSLHAILAFSMQYLGRIRATSTDDSTGQQITAFRHSAKELCISAVRGSARPISLIQEPVLDTTMVLFNLDSLTSAAGPWNERLTAVHERIESIGGINALSMLPRLHAQITMLVWWDCSIALFSRTEPIFPSSYHDFVLTHDNDEASDIFALSGVPKELFKYFRELAQLAMEKELVSKMKYAKFDDERALQIDRCIRDFTVEEYNYESTADGEESVHNWYDYYHGTNVWKYGLLLYIARVLMWDRTAEPSRREIASLSRLILDSARCCRPDSKLQKQFVYPIFLAGSESTDSYSRKFITEYFEEWYRRSPYAMFKEGLDLLREIWEQKDKANGETKIWWGSVVNRRPPDASQFLLG